MKSVANFGLIIIGTILVGVGAGGCAAGVSPSDTLAQALDKLAQQGDQSAALNRLTVGDLIAGFQQYLNQAAASSDSAGSGDASESTAASAQQEQQIAQLQGQLDQGQLSTSQFAAAVKNAMIASNGPAEMHLLVFGGPFDRGAPSQITDPLQLTDQQRQQADGIFQQEHSDIQNLRQNAHADIQAVLTADQLNLLQQLDSHPSVTPIAAASSSQSNANSQTSSPVGPAEALAQALNLSPDQITKIAQIREDLRAAVRARHQQAAGDFRNILTADQQQRLDTLDAVYGGGFDSLRAF